MSTPTSIGTLESSSAEPLSGTMVATMDSTSSMAGTARATFMAAPLNGKVKTRGRSGSTERSLRKAGNIGM